MIFKRGLSIGFLSLYLVAISYPFVLNCSYTLNKTYISQNKCINRFAENSTCGGKCYLSDMLEQHGANQNNGPASSAETMYIYEVTSHLAAEVLNTGSRSVSVIGFTQFTDEIPGDYYPGILAPPPKSV